MQSQGLLVKSFPIVLGCDAAGVVVDTGSGVKAKFQPGDEVCGCTRLGFPGHSTFQEYVSIVYHLLEVSLDAQH